MKLFHGCLYETHISILLKLNLLFLFHNKANPMQVRSNCVARSSYIESLLEKTLVAMSGQISPRSKIVPEIIYGTAFKFENTASLVEAALKVGFRAIDTAGSQSAYREALVGEGIAAALACGTCSRSDLFVCTCSLYI